MLINFVEFPFISKFQYMQQSGAVFIYALLTLYGLYSVLFSKRVTNFTLSNSLFTLTLLLLSVPIYFVNCHVGTEINNENHRTAFLVNKAMHKTRDRLTVKMVSLMASKQSSK